MQSGSRLQPRHVARVLLLLAVLAATVVLTQCQKTGDSINGVNVGMFKRKDECLAKCQSDFQKRNQAEDQLHQQKLAACAGNPTCISNENARHEAAQRDSKQQKDACTNGCHQQGGGTSGP